MQTATHWRASGSFVASSALFGGILDETRLYLALLAEQTGTVSERVQQAGLLLVDGALLQRARSSRKSIVSRINTRLNGWSPQAWVLDDLVAFAQAGSPSALQAALLIHVCRQDVLLYAIVQELIWPRWQVGESGVTSSDVQCFLDSQMSWRPEIEGWSRQTRERLGSTTLAILRDYGLLQGKARKKIVEPIVPGEVITHLTKLLHAEGIPEAEIASHPDWRLWLWDAQRTQQMIAGQASG
jgi:hypothetical protein